MKLDIENKEWGQFKLSTIFEIENCKCSKVSSLQQGHFPYVGASNRNNGVLHFVKPIQELRTKGNCIAFICDGEGSVGYSIYKKEDFIGSTTVKVGRNNNLNKYIGSFITTIADTVRSKYNFGFKRNEKHLKNEILMFPINSKGEPDYKFMEQYMRHKEQKKQEEYQQYIHKRITKLKKTPKTVSLKEKKWSEFFLNEVFKEIQRGKRLKKADHIEGSQPYISSTGSNNGLDGYVGNAENVRIFNNCITLANSGSVGSCFYQPYSFVASDHVTKLENEYLDKSVYLFIASIVSRLGVKYSFNREMNDTRIKREKIMLPINNNNQPDYEFMDNYMKNLEYKKLTGYLKFKRN